MKVLTHDQERVLQALLKLAGGAGVLEMAMLRARNEKGDDATLDDVLRHLAIVKRELRDGAQTDQPAAR